MSLTQDLAILNKANREKIPGEALEIMDRATEELKEKHLAERSLKVGDQFPEANLIDANKNTVNVASLYAETPLVVLFYRGGWCPYCNMELRAFQQHLEEIKSEGARLVAITPETPDNSLTTAEKNELEFEVLSDIDNRFAKSLGLVFSLPESLKQIYEQFGIDLKKHHQNTDFELPMPATFIIDKGGSVRYSFIDEDYTKRADPAEVITALKNM
ncbi:peroxiredoxin-like family protein [Robertkochia aurantiaca]|uniref:peroxiredoxin-like family protein n=1 Tax=Robertkochia aurantiaca TaxID=2873700 RepID=UPI001CCAB456|nr:peroxiredoxin-like family protein [Robertkochia sp. 3YJGBD-33]